MCGHCEQANRKSQAEFVCQSCGFAAPADWNAAVNISRAEVKQLLVSALAGYAQAPACKQGYLTFYRSENGVWLVDAVPPRYLRIAQA